MGTMAAWPELWITDQLVPSAFSHFGNWESLPENGLAVRFAGAAYPGQFGLCPSYDTTYRWTVDSAVVVRNRIIEDTVAGIGGGGSQCGGSASCNTNGNMQVTILDCVTAPSGPNGGMNHVELKVSESQIVVYATDAGTTAPRRKLLSSRMRSPLLFPAATLKL